MKKRFGSVDIVGPAGCGTSAMLRLIAGLDPPTSATIETDRVTRGRASNDE
jgi:ABC-type nitrate/sulfonate/bicarbonate transport system ATPase subunit